MLRLIVILVIFAIFFVPARIIRVEDEKAISFQQKRLPQMTREQIP
jgi:lipopolysaccharide/colanic/teichoic acid biosynthesis glycosyltransferase